MLSLFAKLTLFVITMLSAIREVVFPLTILNCPGFSL
jgi:hypothetical protein